MDIVFLGMNSAGEEVLQWLRQREEVEVLEVINDREGLQKIRDLRPELVIASGFEHIVPEEIIDVPEGGIVNLHPSYLPYNRGSHPYIWPLIDGSPAGVSIHYMNDSIDEGPVIARRKVEKKPEDTAYSLRERLMEEQAELFRESWGKILEGEAEEQDLEKGSYHVSDDLDEISWLDLEEEMSLGEAINLIRGLTYRDKALAMFERNGEKFSIGVDIGRE